MGITIHYRGTIDDLADIESLEDRLLDLVFSLGGRATIWRSYATHDPSRIIRGLLIEMEPGQDTLSLLISPEGHLTPLTQIPEAEQNPFDEPPYCFVKTQFGSPLGHVAIIKVLEAIQKQYFSDLSIMDEGEFHETCDFNTLCKKMNLLDNAIHTLARELPQHGLNPEAAEDPNILASRIERIASLVKKKLSRKSTDIPKVVSDNSTSTTDEDHEPTLEEEVRAFDEIRRKSDLRTERMMRSISEAEAAGLSAEEAWELAMQGEGLSISEPSKSQDRDYIEEENLEPHLDSFKESWRESLADERFEDEDQDREYEPHPAVTLAQDFVSDVMDLAKESQRDSSFFATLTRASFEIMGGLAQATSGDLEDRMDRALSISQLKRALHGHGFARGAVFGLRNEGLIDEAKEDSLQGQLKVLLNHIHERAERAWSFE